MNFKATVQWWIRAFSYRIGRCILSHSRNVLLGKTIIIERNQWSLKVMVRALCSWVNCSRAVGYNMWGRCQLDSPKMHWPRVQHLWMRSLSANGTKNGNERLPTFPVGHWKSYLFTKLKMNSWGGCSTGSFVFSVGGAILFGHLHTAFKPFLTNIHICICGSLQVLL